ncbi:hypothetical protein D3P08_17675 [Paenibacillus nanensis]|uniref:Sporulation protein n=1 Tax=Paenibacillus nanensis TaxID=393251 RepID=A0A3A1USS9_9BACL|nr:hypothetical protein [Paenibacillus nanensis]RIX51295.1 hypothetical protein D3P08_17675 [Paenibacillus nanensis]
MAFKKGYRKGRRMWRLLWIGVYGSLLLLLVSGCGQNADGQARVYRNDGYMGLTNTNPNLLNRSGTSYDFDMEMVGQLLKPIRGIENTQVGFNGDEMNVTLRVSRSLTDKERKAMLAEAQSLLQSNFPRYDVHVKVKS